MTFRLTPSRLACIVTTFILSIVCFSEVSQAATVSTNGFEPLGPSSRRTALVISEIMYAPADKWGPKELEFIELWNSGIITEDLTGHRLTGEIEYTFPPGTTLAPQQFLVVAKDPVAAQEFYGVTFLGPYSGKLNNDGGSLILLNELGGRLLQIDYSSRSPWPVAASGSGHSLVLSRPSYGENDPRAWSISDTIGGSPKAVQTYGEEPLAGVVINEILAHTDPPLVDFIELFNTTMQPINLSGAWLSDDIDTNKFRIPNGTIIPARGYVAFTQSQLGFGLSADGESVFLVNSNETRVIDAVDFPGQENGVSWGRYPNGTPGFQRLNSVTLGTANGTPRLSPVVINEIMYHPISENDDDEYVELYNRSGSAVDISGWQLQEGISYTFPPNTILAPNAYIVVAANRTNLIAKYPQLNNTNTFGNFSGRLSNSGERIVLAKVDDLISTTGGVTVTNLFYIPMNEVTYADGGRWGKWSDGGGSSLELIDPNADTRLAPNWADSDESSKASWTTIDITSILENGQASVHEGSGFYGVANRFEMFLQGEGEALIDDIQFLNNNGPNMVANGNFSSGTTGWTLRGVLRNSFVENGVGTGGSPALHMVSAARGDTGANKISRALSSTALTGGTNTGTMRAQVRWLKGSPYILLRLRGNWMEVSQRLNTPTNCGTPGLSNSRRVANAGPAITEVSHYPVLPSGSQPVVVRARVADPNGVSSVSLHYRIDPANTYATVAMLDNGTGGDAIAGDGIYSVTLPGRNIGTLAAFYITANDNGAAATQFPAEANKRECLIRWGETNLPGVFGTYRLWVTAANVSFWASREKNANDTIDATFVYNNVRAVYNVDTMYSGSPFHTPVYDTPIGFPCDYEVNFHPDERFLGSEPFVLTAYDAVIDNFFMNDDSAQVDITGNWIARKLGQQYNHRRHVRMFVNGIHRGTIYDDTQQPNSEMVEEYFPDDVDGDLRKIESWFEFADNAQDQGSVYATLQRFNKSNGEIDTKRYRWNWRPRATRDPNNWTAFTNLVAAVNNTSAPNYEDIVRTWMDVPNFLRPIVTHHICGSWDSYAYSRGKNMFAYKPDNLGWRLLMWDIEISLGAGGDGPTTDIYVMFDTTLRNMILNVPAFHREYLRGFREALDTALAPGAVNQALDERYAAFQAAGIPLVSPDFIKSYINSRRNYLQSVIPNANFAISSPSYQVINGTNMVTITGTGPLSVENILVNGVSYKVTWTSVTNWSVTVPLNAGNNVLNILATDRHGTNIAGATGSVTVNYTGANVDPEGFVIFNEIQYKPSVEGAAYVELFNSHSNRMFDLSGWTINGLGYTFPSGTTLAPRSYLVLANNRQIFNTTYGITAVAFDEYPGTLDPNGETLTLLRPGVGTNQIVVNRVRHESVAPWPVITNNASLQLIDASQPNSRVANWTAHVTVGPEPQSLPNLLPLNSTWRYMQTQNLDGSSWFATNYNDSAWPSGAGLLAAENNPAITPLIQTTLNAPNLAIGGVQAGHAYYFRTQFNLSNDLTGYQITASAYIDDGAVIYVNGVEAKRIRMNGGAANNMTLANALPPGDDALSADVFVLPSSLFRVGTNYIAVSVHQRTTGSTDIVFGLKLDAVYISTLVTPGRQNAFTATLPPFPPLWLNELQANNSTGPTDNFGQRDPWVEIINTSATNVSLSGLYLSDDYSNLTKWAFQPASVASNGFTLVWCDNQTDQTTPSAIHAGLTLASGSGRLALSRVVNGTPQVLDYLNYYALPANWSYGDVPDAQPFFRQQMFFPTPGATNNGAAAPITVFINEWLADNTATLADPADGGYEDWFELYNAGTESVNLGGYYLTDNLANKFQFQIPDNGHYVIPPGGFLLVWADNEANQNSTNRADLHVNFALSKGGEALGLFAADGTMIDAVTFGAQTTDVSEGRFPNGAANIYSMPTPTPRASNVVPNNPPVLEPIADQVVTLGQTLNLQAVATDADLPGQTLSFSFATAPASATIGSSDGVITWTPSIAPANNTFAIVVTDNGIPSLSATQSFSVITAPMPEPANYRIAENAFQFSWSSVAGQKFQVEFKDNLNDPQWLPISGILTGTGGTMSFTNVLEDESIQRFFRLKVLP